MSARRAWLAVASALLLTPAGCTDSRDASQLETSTSSTELDGATTTNDATSAPAPVTIFVRNEAVAFEDGGSDISIDLVLDGIRVTDGPIVVGRSDADATFSTTFPVGEHELRATADGQETVQQIVVSAGGNWVGVAWLGHERGPESLSIEQYEEAPFFG